MGKWVARQRRMRRMGRLSPERTSLLDALGFDWNPVDAAFEAMFAELKRYRERSGHCNVPSGWPENPKLGTWVNTLRSAQRKGDLSVEKKARLEELGFVFNPFEAAWETMFAELKRYKERFGDCNVPKNWSENPGLAAWLEKQRQKKDGMTAERKARLDALGVVWDAFADQWEVGFQHLAAFVREHGHCKAIAIHVTADGYPLGRWVRKQRSKKNEIESQTSAAA